MGGVGEPRISVVVRSCNRLAALVALLTALFAQDHVSFEIVVIDQSTFKPRADVDPRRGVERPRFARPQPYAARCARYRSAGGAAGDLRRSRQRAVHDPVT